jgi:hypothetical protein
VWAHCTVTSLVEAASADSLPPRLFLALALVLALATPAFAQFLGSIDAPAPNATGGRPFQICGWALYTNFPAGAWLWGSGPTGSRWVIRSPSRVMCSPP